MKRRKIAFVLAGAMALSGGAFMPPAQAGGAASQSTTAACTLGVGLVNASGAQGGTTVTAGTPPTMSTPGTTPGVFKPGQVRLSSTFVSEPSVGGVDRYGWVVQGDSLYYRFYNFNEGSDFLTRIGGGWTNFTAFEVARYDEGLNGSAYHNLAYGLRGDGTLFRWNVSGNSWRSTGSATGFAAVKSMALISKTRTYDTFLANTRGGALYTIRIPITSPMKPIVTPIRTRTWQGFEKLVAGKCGKNGTMLVAIDKDTRSGYVYAVSHANGTATVINGLGKVNGTFPDQVYFRWGVVPDLDPLNGD